jgi:uncharacterized integral membrane protein
MRVFMGLLLLIFLGAVLLFTIENLDPVPLNVLGRRVELPLGSLLAGGYVLGALSGGLVFGFLRYSLRKASERPRGE